MKGTRQSEEPIIAILKKCGAGDSTAPLLQTSSPLKHLIGPGISEPGGMLVFGKI
jgi:hypothetical protein